MLTGATAADGRMILKGPEAGKKNPKVEVRVLTPRRPSRKTGRARRCVTGAPASVHTPVISGS